MAPRFSAEIHGENGAMGDAAGFAYLIGAVWSRDFCDPNSADWALRPNCCSVSTAFPLGKQALR